MSTVVRNLKQAETWMLFADFATDRIELIRRGFTPKAVEAAYSMNRAYDWAREKGLRPEQMSQLADAWGIRK